jgi:hypothetical protein
MRMLIQLRTRRSPRRNSSAAAREFTLATTVYTRQGDLQEGGLKGGLSHLGKVPTSLHWGLE